MKTAAALAIVFLAGCSSLYEKPPEEIARVVLLVRLAGFIAVLIVAYFFVFRFLKKRKEKKGAGPIRPK